MPPLLPFDRILELCNVRGWADGHHTLTLDRQGLILFLKTLLDEDQFDKSWYLETYPDVAEAIAAGELDSAWNHYREFGYFEGRLPGLGDFDPELYVHTQPDLAALLSVKDLRAAATRHFIEYGYREGRPPSGRPKPDEAGK